MADEAATEAAPLFELDVVEPGFEVNEGNILVAPQEAPVALRLVELVLVLVGAFVYRYDILYHAVGLPGLPLGD